MENFQNEPVDPQADLRSLLPREVFQEVIFTLSHSLPPPVGKDPVDEARRDRVAMAGVAALWPVNAAEARLAAEYVATGFWASHCLRLACERGSEFDVARQCRAQATSMMREGKSALRMLLKLQQVRKAVEADDLAAGQAAWVEHCALGIMSEVLSEGPQARESDMVSEPAEAAGEARSVSDEAGQLADVPGFGILSDYSRAETTTRPGRAISGDRSFAFAETPRLAGFARPRDDLTAASGYF